MLVRMTAASHNRRLGLVLAAGGYLAVTAAFVFLESGRLGLGHFFYLPIILVALSSDALGGILGGLLAAGCYSIAVVLDPAMPSRDALTTQTGLRAITFALVGGVVGLYASRNRDLVDKLRDHASTDFVTGVCNVRAFDEELRRRVADGTPFTLVMLDVDELRRVNEVHGHLAGDRALRAVASALLGEAREADLVARVGGDEFAALGPDTPERAARGYSLLAREGVTVTVAAVSFPADAETADDLFKKAGDRLFAAKLVRANRRTLAAV